MLITKNQHDDAHKEKEKELDLSNQKI